MGQSPGRQELGTFRTRLSARRIGCFGVALPPGDECTRATLALPVPKRLPAVGAVESR